MYQPSPSATCAILYIKQVGLFPCIYYTHNLTLYLYISYVKFNSYHYFAVVVVIFVLDLVFPDIDLDNLRYRIVHDYPIDLPLISKNIVIYDMIWSKENQRKTQTLPVRKRRKKWNIFFFFAAKIQFDSTTSNSLIYNGGEQVKVKHSTHGYQDTGEIFR